MAERRMFAKTIIDSDAFIDMPTNARLLYYDLAMRADDDGFINNPRKVTRMTNASDDDLKVLIDKSFIILFESGVIVIKHWKMHNYIQADRYKPTVYADEMKLLEVKDNKAYTISTAKSTAKPKLLKGKTLQIGNFKRPTIEEVNKYCKERQNKINAEQFIAFYDSKGWKVGTTPMKDWKSAIRTWEIRQQSTPANVKTLKHKGYDQRDNTGVYDEFESGNLESYLREKGDK